MKNHVILILEEKIRLTLAFTLASRTVFIFAKVRFEILQTLTTNSSTTTIVIRIHQVSTLPTSQLPSVLRSNIENEIETRICEKRGLSSKKE